MSARRATEATEEASRWLLSGLLAVEALALTAWPFVPGRVLGTLVLLTLPFALMAGALLTVFARAWPKRLTVERSLGAGVAAMVTATGIYIASCLTIWGPYDPATYVIDASGMGLGLLLAVRLVRRPRAAAVLRRWGVGDTLASSALACLLGLLFLAGDAFIFPSGYFLLHEALWLVGAAGLLVGAQRAVQTWGWRGLRRGALVAVALACAFAIATPRSSVAVETRTLALSSLISHRAFVRSLWKLLDRDGDGFSPYFGGTDCDDADPRAYPLSTIGRDCTQLLGEWAQASPPPTAAREPLQEPLGHAPTTWHRPRVVLLVTIDAFRCGFGQGEAPDLRDVCPHLTRLGSEGRLRTDVHTSATQTRWALGSLLGPRAEPYGLQPLTPLARETPPALVTPGPSLASLTLPAPLTPSFARRMASLGYATHAVPTCAYARVAPGVSDFDELDPSLIAGAHNGAGVSVGSVNAALLARGRAALAPGAPPVFLWAHEMDPHAPYLTTADTRLVLSPRRQYAAEIRRTDAALGELVQALVASEERPGDVWIVVSADHGEELGEHGLAFHGAQVFEESTRIPLVVWSSALDHREHLPPALPPALGEIGGYVTAALAEVAFVPSPRAFSWAPLTGDLAAVEGAHKVIFHPRLGLFEAFDLARDPGELAPLVGSLAPSERPELPAWARRLAGRLVEHLISPRQ